MLSAEDRAARAEARQAKKREEREARRAANVEAWRADPRNINNIMSESRTAAAPIEVEALPDASDSGALQRLREVVCSDGPLSFRVDAASTAILYELAPSSAGNMPPDEVASMSMCYGFLQSVVGSSAAPAPVKLKALKALVAVEASKARVTDAGLLSEQRNLFIARANAMRRMALIEAGCWRRICLDGSEWEIKSADDIDLSDLAKQAGSDSISTMLDRALSYSSTEREQRARARRERLLSARARDRSDNWEALIHDAAAD